MRRYSGQKALYEAMTRSGSKTRRKSVLARLRPQLERLRPQLEKLAQIAKKPAKGPVTGGEPTPSKPGPTVLKPPKAIEVPRAESPAPAQTWLRPKAVQINDGRLEVSLPYQIGIIIGLGVVLTVLMLFHVGRLIGRMDEKSRYGKAVSKQQADLRGTPARSTALPTDEGGQAAGASSTPDTDTSTEAAAAPGGAAKPVPTGDNVIVLARHSDESQLVPVQEYFRDHGIETRIVSYRRLRSVFQRYGLDVSRLPQGDGFMLVTFNLYGNPDSEGTDGYAVKQKIIELGRGYKAPLGHESFATHYFSDAYGMKVTK
ncbi:MAG: hypothetical protein JSW27_24785 [Phycisphaerales bacterium]|nr:MAG: hypothetical protein JSW27_24785 [Phycisphaerales bacterium]